MLGFIFGFNARLGRLAYFLSSIAYGFGLLSLGALFVFAFDRSSSSGDAHEPETVMIVTLITGIVLSVWVGMCLLSMRVRDMGWNPAIVIPSLWAILAVDVYAAIVEPAWAMPGAHLGTPFGAATNFLFNLAVMFSPSAGDRFSPAGVPDVLGPRVQQTVRRSVVRSMPAEPASLAARQAPSRSKSFGRLGPQN